MSEPKISNPTLSEVTKYLRFVERDGKKILQQMHEIKTFDAESIRCIGLHGEWRDVPIEAE